MAGMALTRRRLLAAASALPVAAWAQDRGLIFAAASLRGPLDRALRDGPPATVSYAGSQILARQIAAGAPADLFLSANAAWARYASDATEAPPPEPLLGNRLVLAVRGAADPVSFEAAWGAVEGRIAIGFVEAVPAGIYAAQALRHADLWQDAEPRLVQTENVRVALALVRRGEVGAALVYATDAAADPDVGIAAAVPSDWHEPIRYWAAVVGAGEALLAHLRGVEARAVFAAAGFLPA